MAFTVTNVSQAREMAEQAQNKLESAQKTMAKIREKAEGAIQTGIQIAEVSGTSFAFGYANGRWGENGELTIGGVPVDLGAAVALHGVAFLGGLGKYAEHGHNMGTGALAACAYRTGAQMGAENANKPPRAAGDHQQQGQPPWLNPMLMGAGVLPQSPQSQAAQPQMQVPQNFMPPTPAHRG
jgi:hypothetical protein